MPDARTLDRIVIDTLGLQAMTICRLQWQVEDLTAQLQEAKAKAAPSPDTQPPVAPGSEPAL